MYHQDVGRWNVRSLDSLLQSRDRLIKVTRVKTALRSGEHEHDKQANDSKASSKEYCIAYVYTRAHSCAYFFTQRVIVADVLLHIRVCS